MQYIPFLEITARDHHDLGFQIGQKFKKDMRRRLTTNKILYRKLKLADYPTLISKVQKFLPPIIKHFPELMDEIQGLSKGSEIELKDLMLFICDEELFDFRVPRCTSLAVKTEDAILVGHNEDWLPSFRRHGLYLIRATLKDRPFLSLAYLGGLPGSVSGLNSSGLCFTGNSINTERFRYGVPKNIQLRALLECHNPKEALLVDTTDSSIVSNSIYAWKGEKMFDVEDHFLHHDVFRNTHLLVHTNHPLRPNDQNKKNTSQESIDRYTRAQKILATQKTPDERLVKTILTDHVSGICGHAKRGDTSGVTIASVIINPKEKWMKVAWGNPCRHVYRKFHLKPN